MARTIYVGGGTYQAGGEHLREGITIFRFADGMLTEVGKMESGHNPSFLAMHPNQPYLYAVNETRDGAVSAFSVDRATGALSFINRVMVGGDAPCYVTVTPDGQRLLIANYSSGNLTVVPVRSDGSLGEQIQHWQHSGSSGLGGNVASQDNERGITLTVERSPKIHERAQPGRQEHAHAHSVILDPSGRYALAADLGMDRIWVYAFREGLLLPPGEREATTMTWQDETWPVDGSSAPVRSYAGASTTPGDGPRHIVFYPNGRFFFVANELDSSVSVWRWREDGGIQPLVSYSTLPEGFDGENTSAQIQITPDGKFLYVSNRGHNSLAGFSVNPDTGALTPIGHFASGGNWPRNFTIDPEGNYLLAANQNSNSLVAFRIDPVSGGLTLTGSRAAVHEPMFVLVADW